MQLLLINCFSADLLETRLKTKVLNEIADEAQFLKNAIEKTQANNVTQFFNLNSSDLKQRFFTSKICIILSHYFWNKTKLIDE